VIAIDVRRCTGCGACIEACPTGAIYLVDGKAAVDGGLCRECEACLGVCPGEAIRLTGSRERVPEPVLAPVPRQEPEVIRIRTSPAPLSLSSQVLPVLGAALAWTGRELVLRLAGVLLDRLDRSSSSFSRQRTNLAGRSGSGRSRDLGGSRRRRRQRWGGRHR
jgi:NAD-dependent dihydropyrimidine dehydrogenase PreA subunit